MAEIYDILIIGGGPAGLAAGIYGGRAKLKTAILEKGTLGGMAYSTREMVNYPGFRASTGPDLTRAMVEHARGFGVEIIKEEVEELELNREIKTVKTHKGNAYRGRTIILAVGSQPRSLNIPGEAELRGNGVSYCATCDAEFYEDLHVVVVGNGDAAVEEAMYITKFAKKVSIIVIHDEGILDCNKHSAEKALKNNKIEFIWNSVLTSIEGGDEVKGVIVKNLKNGSYSELQADGVFIYIGIQPNTEFLKGQIEMDERGYIIASGQMETSVNGVYAVGDARVKYLRQVVTAVGDGATAAVAAERYLNELDDLKDSISESEKTLLLAFWDPVNVENIGLIALLEEVVSKEGNLKLIKVDMSRRKMIAQKYGVSKIPTILLFKPGREAMEVEESDIYSGKILELTNRF